MDFSERLLLIQTFSDILGVRFLDTKSRLREWGRGELASRLVPPRQRHGALSHYHMRTAAMCPSPVLTSSIIFLLSKTYLVAMVVTSLLGLNHLFSTCAPHDDLTLSSRPIDRLLIYFFQRHDVDLAQS